MEKTDSGLKSAIKCVSSEKKNLNVSFHEESITSYSSPKRRVSLSKVNKLEEAFSSPSTDDQKRLSLGEETNPSALDLTPLRNQESSDSMHEKLSYSSPCAKKVHRRLSDMVANPEKIDNELIPQMQSIMRDFGSALVANKMYEATFEKFLMTSAELVRESENNHGSMKSAENCFQLADSTEEGLRVLQEEIMEWEKEMKNTLPLVEFTKESEAECSSDGLEDKQSMKEKRRLSFIPCLDCDARQNLCYSMQATINQLESKLEESQKEKKQLSESLYQLSSARKSHRSTPMKGNDVTDSAAKRRKSIPYLQPPETEEVEVQVNIDSEEEAMKISTLTACLDEVTNQLSELSNAKKENEANLVKSYEDFKNLKSRYEEVNKTFLNKSKDFNQLKEKYEDIKEYASTLDRDMDETIAKFKKELCRLRPFKKESIELKECLKLKSSELSEARLDNSRLKVEVTSLKSNLNYANSQLGKIDDIKKLAEKEKLENAKTRENADREKTKYKQQLEAEIDRVKKINDKLQPALENIEHLKSQVKQEKSLVAQTNEENARLRRHLKEKARKGDSLDKAIEKLREEHDVVVDRMKKEIRIHLEQEDHLRKQITSARAEHGSVEQRFASLKVQKIEVERENDDLKQDLAKVQLNINDLTKEMKLFKEKHDNEIKLLQSQKSDLVLLNSQLCEQLEFERSKGVMAKVKEVFSGHKDDNRSHNLSAHSSKYSASKGSAFSSTLPNTPYTVKDHVGTPTRRYVESDRDEVRNNARSSAHSVVSEDKKRVKTQTLPIEKRETTSSPVLKPVIEKSPINTSPIKNKQLSSTEKSKKKVNIYEKYGRKKRKQVATPPPAKPAITEEKEEFVKPMLSPIIKKQAKEAVPSKPLSPSYQAGDSISLASDSNYTASFSVFEEDFEYTNQYKANKSKPSDSGSLSSFTTIDLDSESILSPRK